MRSMKDAALEYAMQGWPVFPCTASKRPYTERGVLEATTSKKQIEAWWEEFPKANIGCDVGGAGLVVLDLDPGHDAEALRKLLGTLDTKLVQRSPRGGLHLFFERGRDIIPPSAGKLLPHVDVRSHHSYVLLAPSRTKDGSYEWKSRGKPSYRPDKLVELATAAREKDEDHDTWIIEPDLEENIEAAVHYLKTEAQVAIEGVNGDDMAYRTAAMCKSYGLSPETAFDVMWQHWNKRCLPPWGADEADHLEAKVLNAYRYNTSPPGNLTQAYKVARQQALFKPVSRDTKDGGKETEVGRFRFVDERGVDSIKPPEWLIKDTIPQNAYALLIGPRSTFKTFVALDMALSIATGASAWFNGAEEWLGPWPDIAVTGPVLFAAGEGRAGFRARVQAWKDYHIEGEYTENFYLVDPVPYPNSDDVTAFIEGALALSDYYELVVLDTVGRAMQGLNENSQQDASQFTRMVQTIQAELDCAVLAIHHTGHGSLERARGSSVFGADVDVEFMVERYSNDCVRVRNTKQKDAPEWEDGKLIQLKPHKDSLVAVKATERKEQQASEEEQDMREAPKKRGKGGRRKAVDLAIELTIIRKAAYQAMKSFPGKEWSKVALAQAIAADENVSVAAGTIRNHYVDELLTDKTHPVAQCYDIGKGVWCYQPKGKR